jgi:hypothetical protein
MGSMTSVPALAALQKSLILLDLFAAYFAYVRAFLDHSHLHHSLLAHVDEVEEVGHLNVAADLSGIFLLPFRLEPHIFEAFKLPVLVCEVHQLLVELIVPSQERMLNRQVGYSL